MSRCYVAYLPSAGIDRDHVVVKIGFSRNPAQRFEALTALGWLTPSYMEATPEWDARGLEIERKLHRELRKHRIHHEWFHMPWTVLDKAMDDVCQFYGVNFELVDIGDGLEYPQEQAA